MNRRDILKVFGAGTLITPLVAAAPIARIIEPPKVELFHEIPKPVDLSEVTLVTVRLVMRDGSVRDIQARPHYGAFGIIEPGESLDLTLKVIQLRSPVSYGGMLRAS